MFRIFHTLVVQLVTRNPQQFELIWVTADNIIATYYHIGLIRRIFLQSSIKFSFASLFCFEFEYQKSANDLAKVVNQLTKSGTPTIVRLPIPLMHHEHIFYPCINRELEAESLIDGCPTFSELGGQFTNLCSVGRQRIQRWPVWATSGNWRRPLQRLTA